MHPTGQKHGLSQRHARVFFKAETSVGRSGVQTLRLASLTQAPIPRTSKVQLMEATSWVGDSGVGVTSAHCTPTLLSLSL